MCIINSPVMLEKERAKTGLLVLWKVIRGSDRIGIWGNTVRNTRFQTGENVAEEHCVAFMKQLPGQFHCCFTRKAARQYRQFRDCPIFGLKIIKVYARREDIVQAGVDKFAHMPSISVSKLTIKSLKHQR